MSTAICSVDTVLKSSALIVSQDLELKFGSLLVNDIKITLP